MTTELQQLIESARTFMVSDAMRQEQRISFAYGNLRLDCVPVTRKEVEAAAKRMAERLVGQ